MTDVGQVGTITPTIAVSLCHRPGINHFVVTLGLEKKKTMEAKATTAKATKITPEEHAPDDVDSSAEDSDTSRRQEDEEDTTSSDEEGGAQKLAARRGTRTIPHNAVCDWCDGWIRGKRFKCSECLDYELCHRCHEFHLEETTHHAHWPQHRFVEIAHHNDHSRAAGGMPTTPQIFSTQELLFNGSLTSSTSGDNHPLPDESSATGRRHADFGKKNKDRKLAIAKWKEYIRGTADAIVAIATFLGGASFIGVTLVVANTDHDVYDSVIACEVSRKIFRHPHNILMA